MRAYSSISCGWARFSSAENVSTITRSLSLGAQASVEHVAGLGDDRRWYGELTASLLAQPLARTVIGIGWKSDGYQRSGVDQDH